MEIIEELLESIFQNPIFYALIFIILSILFRKARIYLRNKKIQKNNYELNRDIIMNIKYNPSILGILTDSEINYNEILADIMNLYCKKVINITKDKEEHRYKLELINPSIEITESDKYIINTLVIKNRHFVFSQWRELVLEQGKNLNFIRIHHNEKLKNNKVLSELLKILMPFAVFFIVIILIWLIASIITLNIIDGLGVALQAAFFFPYVVIIGMVISSSIEKRIETRMSLTTLGIEELKKWMGFKTFIEEYTLIKEKTMDDIIIYEKYIPYSLVLGIGKDYKNIIYQIFDEIDLNRLMEDLEKQFYEDNL